MRGFTIAFIGTDGSGKSTMINELTTLLQKLGINQIYYEHLRPNLIPDIGVLLGRRKTQQIKIVSNPHAEPSSSLLGSIIRIAYYWVDYFMGYHFKIRRLTSSENSVFIFDRYVYDFLIDPRRMKISLPKWTTRLFVKSVPEPDIIICLGGDPALLYERKPETSLDEVTRQVGEYRKFAQSNPRCEWIDTGQNIEKSKDEILEAIFRRMSGYCCSR